MIRFKNIGGKAWKALHPKNDNKVEISLFDVKELYDLAYAERAKARVGLKRFRTLLAKAQELDAAYRTQLLVVGEARFGRVAL